MHVFSTTKIMIIMATLMLVDRGLIELDAPVARYWPEFGQGGKGEVTIRDAMTHQAGVPGFTPPVAFEALHDWDAIVARVAAEPHWFEGRRFVSYHYMTYGFILGEVLRRVDGRRPAQFMTEEIAGRAGADFQFGLKSQSDLGRLAELHFPTGTPHAEDSIAARAMASVSLGDWMSWGRLSADIPASVGLANGRSIARLCAIFAMRGTLEGARYVSDGMVAEAATEQVYANDETFGWLRLGLGLGLNSEPFPAPSPTAFHWGGYGGSWGLMDPSVGLSLGFAPNNLAPAADTVLTMDPRLFRFHKALEALIPTL